MIKTEFGMKVRVKFSKTGRFGSLVEAWQEFRNVTEVHYGYLSPVSPTRIAFESDIHETGCTYDISDLAEIGITQETEKVEKF